jgi:hypothetical protein
MNIFFLHHDPTTCAEMHCDRHVVKMILETCQLLCTTWHVTTHRSSVCIPYKKTHVNHPCSRWVRASRSNYEWLCEFGLCLCHEYTYRYGRVHKCEAIIEQLSDMKPDVPDAGWTPPAQAMPDAYKNHDDAVAAYRSYYVHEKSHIHKWTRRAPPDWISCTK